MEEETLALKSEDDNNYDTNTTINDTSILLKTKQPISTHISNKKNTYKYKQSPSKGGFFFKKKNKSNIITSDFSKQIIILFFFVLLLIYLFNLYKYFLLPLFLLMILLIASQLPCFQALISLLITIKEHFFNNNKPKVIQPQSTIINSNDTI